MQHGHDSTDREEGERDSQQSDSDVRHWREMFLALLSQMDSYARPSIPLESSVWVAVLAAPLVAQKCKDSSLNEEQDVYDDLYSIVDTVMSDVLTPMRPSGKEQKRDVPTVPCLLPRQAVEHAGDILKLEFDVREEHIPEILETEYLSRTKSRARKSPGKRALKSLTSAEHLVLHILRSYRHNATTWGDMTRVSTSQ